MTKIEIQNSSSSGIASIQNTGQSPQEKRRELSNRIQKFIRACRVVMMNSKSPAYKMRSRWNALDMAINLERLCGRQSSLRELCSYTLKVSHYLKQILPLESHNSYQTDCSNLEKIINDCKTMLQPKTYVQ